MEDNYYITVSGDTWDIVAHKFYKNSRRISGLILANERYSNILIFKAGIKLIIPTIKEKRDEKTAPWRR